MNLSQPLFARMCCKSARHWLTAAPHSNSTQITDGCGIGQLLCFRCMQTITADTVIAYVTHNDRPNISSASSQHEGMRRGGLFIGKKQLDWLIFMFAINYSHVTINCWLAYSHWSVCLWASGGGQAFFSTVVDLADNKTRNNYMTKTYLN